MTDSEMLKQIFEKVSSLESDMKMVNNRLDKIDSEVSALRAGQIELRKEIKQVDKRVSDTYNLALEAWGTSTENRKSDDSPPAPDFSCVHVSSLHWTVGVILGSPKSISLKSSR